MSNINYDEINEITVHNQEELDDIPFDFKGIIYIECTVTVEVTNRYLWGVKAYGNATVTAYGNAMVTAYGNATVTAYGNAMVTAYGNATVTAYGNAMVTAYDTARVTACGNAMVTAYDTARVTACDTARVTACDTARVTACGNVQVVNRLVNGKIKLSGNAREVFMPKTIVGFMDFYGIKHTKTKAVFYKAVRKSEDGILYANYNNSFKYTVGGYQSEPNINTDVTKNCGSGIHISNLNWALDFGKDWSNLVIIEVATKIDDIVLPENTDGKVRTSKVKVLREVPLEECGKILAKQRNLK